MAESFHGLEGKLTFTVKGIVCVLDLVLMDVMIEEDIKNVTTPMGDIHPITVGSPKVHINARMAPPHSVEVFASSAPPGPSVDQFGNPRGAKATHLVADESIPAKIDPINQPETWGRF